MRTCSKCTQDKPEEDYYRQRNPDGTYRIYWMCKKCFAEYRKARPKKQIASE